MAVCEPQDVAGLGPRRPRRAEDGDDLVRLASQNEADTERRLEVDLMITMPSGEASSVSLALALSSRATEDARALLREMPPSA